MEKPKYVSMFKINGIPILPPLMTDERRREMTTYKNQAVALETRLKSQAKESKEFESISTVDDEYLKVSSMLQRPSSAETTLKQLSKLVTSIDDSTGRSFLQKEDVSCLESLLCPNTAEHSTQASIELLKTPPSARKGISSTQLFTTPTGKWSTPLPGKSPLNNVFINQTRVSINNDRPALNSSTKPKNISASQNICNNSTNVVQPSPEEITTQKTPVRKDLENVKTTQRASTSPALRQSSPSPTPKLIRSGSFTLESPSQALLEHLSRTVGIPTKNTSRSPEKATTKSAPSSVTSTPEVRRKLSSLAPNNEISKPGAKQPHLKSGHSKTKPSPYDVKVCTKPKQIKKHKIPSIRITSATLKSKISPNRSKLALNEISRRSVVRKEKISPKTLRSSSERRRSPGSVKTAILDHLAARPATDRPSLLRNAQPGQTSTPTHAHSVTAAGNLSYQSVRQSFVNAEINEIEEMHRMRILELLQKQQQEQRNLQEQFERQQKLLLKEFNTDLMSLKSLQISPVKSESMSIYQNDSNNNRNGFSSTDDQPASLEDSQGYDLTSTLATSVDSARRTNCSRRLFMESKSPEKNSFLLLNSPKKTLDRVLSPSRRDERIHAATIINAYVRGYLTRRLFRTDHVQNIIQTIRDTLQFAIRVYEETLHDKSEENMMFKARLLQQLTSGCKSLQAVFSLPAKERMSLIARDRVYHEMKGKGPNKVHLNKSQSRRKLT